MAAAEDYRQTERAQRGVREVGSGGMRAAPKPGMQLQAEGHRRWWKLREAALLAIGRVADMLSQAEAQPHFQVLDRLSFASKPVALDLLMQTFHMYQSCTTHLLMCQVGAEYLVVPGTGWAAPSRGDAA